MKSFHFLLGMQTIVTGAGDETLRFWNVFPSKKTEVIINCQILVLNVIHSFVNQ